MGSRTRITSALIGLVVLVLVGWLVREQWDAPSGPAAAEPSVQQSKPGAPPGADSGLPVRTLSALPREAADTWLLIERGGPFSYPRADGGVFENREKLLPAKGSGYYHEYTVATPGSDDRGARRLVTGSGDELYYTDDHYGSFVVVDPGR